LFGRAKPGTWGYQVKKEHETEKMGITRPRPDGEVINDDDNDDDHDDDHDDDK